MRNRFGPSSMRILRSCRKAREKPYSVPPLGLSVFLSKPSDVRKTRLNSQTLVQVVGLLKLWGSGFGVRVLWVHGCVGVEALTYEAHNEKTFAESQFGLTRFGLKRLDLKSDLGPKRFLFQRSCDLPVMSEFGQNWCFSVLTFGVPSAVLPRS